MRKTACVLLAALMLFSLIFTFEISADEWEAEEIGEPGDMPEDELPVTKYELCDVNRDGEVNNKDVTLIFRFTSGMKVTIDKSLADFDSDKEITNKDVVGLFRYLSVYREK